MREPEVPPQVRIISGLLIVGAIWGILFPFAAYLLSPRLRATVAAGVTALDWAMFVVALGVFAWCLWLGYSSWDGEPWALRLAKWTFLLQIPRVAFPGVSYQFDTLGLTVGVSSVHRWHLLFNLGCDFVPVYAPANQDVILGLNVVAIFAASYLFKITAPGYREPKPGDNLGLI